MVYVFLTKEGTKYKGKAIYYRYLLKRNLTKEQIKEIFLKLYKELDGRLLAVKYNSSTGVMVVFLKKVESLIPLAIVIPAVALIGGIIAGYFLGHGETDYDVNKIVGFSLSFWDIIKMGAIAFIIAGLVKTAVDSYVALTRKEYVPTTPYQVFVEPIAKPISETVRTATTIVPYFIRR